MRLGGLPGGKRARDPQGDLPGLGLATEPPFRLGTLNVTEGEYPVDPDTA